MHEYIQNVRRELSAFSDRLFLTEPVLEVQKILDNFYHAYSIQTANVGNCLIYRVRGCDNNLPHLEPSDLWVPPSDVLKCVGRVNDIGQRIFYGAFHPFTAIREARIAKGQYFSMGVYHLRAMDDYDMTSVVIKTPPRPSATAPLLGQLAHELSLFVASEFTKSVEPGQEHHYKKSSAMAQILLGLPNKESLLYPSVQDADMINIALPESAAARRLTLKSVFHCQLRNDPYALLESRPIAGKLKTVVDRSPIGFRINPVGEPMLFSKIFDNSKITSPDEILRHFMASKQ